MNRRTFLQAVSLAVTAAMVPAVAQAAVDHKRLEVFWRRTVEIVGRYRDTAFNHERHLEGFVRSSDGWVVKLACFPPGLVTFAEVHLSHAVLAARAGLDVWSAQVEAVCEDIPFSRNRRRWARVGA